MSCALIPFYNNNNPPLPLPLPSFSSYNIHSHQSTSHFNSMEDQSTNTHASISNIINNHPNILTTTTQNTTIINTTAPTTTTTSSSSSSSGSRGGGGGGGSEAVRSRWTPKPEQILILESIFNSGMVNPPKEETVRIRKLLEKFGAVGDANVFYWFQNRRSRSRRRQRQLQASLAANLPPPHLAVAGSLEFYDNNTSSSSSHQLNNTCSSNNNTNSSSSSVAVTTSSFDYCGGGGGGGGGVDHVFSAFPGHIMNPHVHHQLNTSSSHTPVLCSNHHSSNLAAFHTGGIVTVFINGVATQVGDGPIEVKTMFGDGVILVHSSGVPVPLNDFGISFQPLQHGESYFLVPRLV